MSSPLAMALSLAANGFRVFPLEPGTKHPAIDDWPNKATSDPARIRRWWTCPVMETEVSRDVAIATGEGLLVIDIDVKDGKRGDETWEGLQLVHGEVPRTLEQSTPSGGTHYFFRSARPVGVGVGTLGRGIDHRGEHGFVKAYHPLEGEIAAAPEWVEAALPPPGARAERAPGKPARIREGARLDDPENLRRAAIWLRDQAPPAIEGDGGDATAYAVAARVKDFGVGEHAALDLMLENWNERCAPPWLPDELVAKVRNAYRYGANAVGALDPNADFGPIGQGTSSGGEIDLMPPKRVIPLEWFAEIEPNLARRALVKGLLDHGAMSVLYGESNGGKTFFALDLAYHIATGDPWRGKRVDQGLAVYVAAEGGDGVRRRVKALRRHFGRGGEPVPLALVPCMVNLCDPKGDVTALADLVAGAEATCGRGARLIVVDTLSRVMAGGDENAPKDMTAFIRTVDILRARTSAHVMVVHHTGKDKAKGARGHSSLRAATDTEIEIGDGRVARATKQRDMEFGPPMPFDLQPVEIGTDADGETVTSCVVIERSPVAPDEDFKLRPQAQKALDKLRALIATHGKEPGEVGSARIFGKSVTLDQWRDACADLAAGGGETAARAWRRVFSELGETPLICVDGDRIWLPY